LLQDSASAFSTNLRGQEMKSNPFYALSASAMLLGCWLLAEALHLQAGHLGSLLILMAVLQLYEGLLVGLGTFLARTGRAPRDGVTVLVLESVFLLDAPLLAAECVTADGRVGTAVAALLAALAVAKLAWVRRTAPGLLSPRAAALLGVQAAFVLAVPVVAARLAWARVFGPIALYGFWWAALALPIAQRSLRDETRSEASRGSSAHAVWTWVPAAMVLLHLWAVGYIHAIDFHPAFLAPLLIGLALTAGREQLTRQVALPALAVLVSLGQRASLAFHFFGAGGLTVSPLRLALLGVAASWAYLAWRDRERWLAVLAVGSGAAFLLGSSATRLADALGRLLDLVGSLVPKDVFGWGVLTVIAAFVLLAAGARRSLVCGPRGPGRSAARPTDLQQRRGRESAAIALALSVFAISAMAAVFEAFEFGHRKQQGAAGLALLAAAAAFVIAARAHGRAVREGTDPAARHLAQLAMAASGLGFVVALAPLAAPPSSHSSEPTAIGDVRTLISAQAAYKAANGGFFDSRLACLQDPAACIPGYPRNGPTFLDASLTSLQPRGGYTRSFVPGPPAEGRPAGVSRSSTRSFAYVAVPAEPGHSGVRGFCGDSSGSVCSTADGRVPRVRPDGTCDPGTCAVLP
jgi:hypothetical protein